MASQEVRLEHLRPDQVDDRWSQSPIAYVPIGCIEFHGPHLPLGVDGLTAHTVCTKAALISGGVVHPISYMANGCLDLPFTLTYSPSIVESWARAIVDQLSHRGAEVVVLLTGHGPLDLIHLLKRVAADYRDTTTKVYGLCYLELNAQRLTSPELGEPTIIDHASTIETSWMLADHGHLVDLSLLPEHEDAKIIGVYGKNPRFTAKSEIGFAQQAACAELLAARCDLMLRDQWSDEMEDLRKFVDFAWPEELAIEVSAPNHIAESTSDWGISIRNPGRASRFVTGVNNLIIDGASQDLTGATLTNSSVGEVGTPMSVGSLHPENGIYVRRGQSLQLSLAQLGSQPQPRQVEIGIELAGVRRQNLRWERTQGHESVEVLDGEGTGT